MLKPLGDYTTWEMALEQETLVDFYDGPSRPTTPDSQDPRQWRLYRRRLAKYRSSNPRFTEDQLDAGFRAHKLVSFDQNELRAKDYAFATIHKAIGLLPNLKHITISNFNELYYPEGNPAMLRHFKPLLLQPCGDEFFTHACGLPQTLSVFRSIHDAPCRDNIDTMRISMISWRIFKLKEEGRDLVRKVFHRLVALELILFVGQHWRGEDPLTAEEDPVSIELDNLNLVDTLLAGGHVDLFQSMPHLQVLDLTIQGKEDQTFDLDIAYVFEDLTWPSLREIHLKDYTSTREGFLNPFSRHSTTLRVVHISNHQLLDGLWLEVFTEMRNHLQLETFVARGFFTNMDDESADDCWSFSLASVGSLDSFVNPYLIGAYVTNTANVTLDDIL
ncbi:MAG: hypothetical protein LQ350_008014 [Teloschistes chrysophthalmus]|nr:MAG: hypothetical protein LQ350_008014 [Niorma chrysophthalma]